LSETEMEAPLEEEAEPVQPLPEVELELDDYCRKAINRILDLMDALGIDEATFKYDGSLSVREMDPSKVCLFEASINLGQRELAEAGKERAFTVKIGDLRKALKLRDPILNVRQVDVVIRGDIGYSSKQAEVSIPLFETVEEEVPEPKISFSVESEVDFDTVRKAFNTIAWKPEHLKLSAEGGRLTVKASNEVERIIVEGFDAEGEGRAVYSWDYLQALKGAWKVSYATDLPMKATKQETAGYGDAKRTISNMTLFLAPRIED